MRVVSNIVNLAEKFPLGANEPLDDSFQSQAQSRFVKHPMIPFFCASLLIKRIYWWNS